MSNPTKHNPWAGLSSYPDPQAGGDQLLFCGRENESYDVARLIDNNVFVTLYGKSGTGKTSLLNAGVFPRLRDKGYLPTSVRLSMDAMDLSFQKGIIQKISQAMKDSVRTQTVEVVPLPDDDQAIEYLWGYFARTRFVDADGQIVFPVIVLDQFEEVFRSRREDAEALLRQIHFMMDESHALEDRVINGQSYSYDFNYRFVIAIREDDLYRLEDSIDNNYLVEMKRCRFRLRNLSEDGARDVVLIPGEDSFAPETKDQIANLLVGMARIREDQTVSAVVLSLVCSRIYDDFLQSGANHIDVPLVEQFIKGNPFEQFYYEATDGLTRKERAYIERNLVDSTGHRNSIPESDFLRIVKNGTNLFEGSKKILQRVSTSSGDGGYRVELIHDSFCEPLAILKEKRELRERSKWLFAALGISLLALFVGLYFARLNRTVTDQKRSLEQTTEKLRSDSLVLAQHVERIQKDSLEMSKINDSLARERDNLGVANRNLRLKNEELEEERSARYVTTAENIALKQDKRNLITELDILKNASATPDRDRGNDAKINTNDAYMNVTEIADGIYEINGLRFITATPTDGILKDWITDSYNRCAEMIKGKTDRYSVSPSMIENHPCLVYLLLNSASITTEKEKQEWFDLYLLMNSDQIMKLYNILYRESYQLGQMQRKYQKKQTEINQNQKYTEILSEYQKYRSLAKLHPETYIDTFIELQDRILDAYSDLNISKGGAIGANKYEVLLSEALEDCEALYEKDHSYKPRLVSLKNRMGELILRQKKVQEAMELFKSAYQLDPVASAPHLALGYNQLAYQYANDGDYATAFEIIEKAIALQPSDARFYDSKGEFLIRIGDKAGALEMWNKVLELNPEFPSNHKNGTELSRQLKAAGLI